MRILVLQFVPALRGKPVPRFAPQLGTLLTLLRSRDHELSLLGLSKFDLPTIKTALAQSLPQLVYADIDGVCSDLARRTFEHIEHHEFLPIVAGGVYATVDPAGCLSMPGVHAVAIGEPDATLVTYFERLKDPAVGQVVSGVWTRDEKGLARPQMPALVEDLDSLPFAERELFKYGDEIKHTGVIEVAVGRGCPQHCTYCTNATMCELYADDEQWTRHRSPENILDEIDELRAAYQPVRLVRFPDHAFALDDGWLDEFLGVYVYRCALPFRCHLRLNHTTKETVRLLDDAGCDLVDIEVISASDFVRNDIFQMNLSNGQIEEIFRRLGPTNIRSRAIVYIGSPYESEAAIDETYSLLKTLKPTYIDVRPYFPYPGTEARATCQENGWIHARGEEQYHGDAAGINMPALRPEKISAFVKKLRSEFPTSLDNPWWKRWSLGTRSAIGHIFHKRR